MSGQFYYRQLGDLAISICAARELTDAYWREFHESSYAVTKQHSVLPKLSAITFAYDHPNAAQRRWSTQFLAKGDVPKIQRIAVFTENVMLRGAMTAFSWFIQDTTLRPFDLDEVRAGLAWLHEIGKFNPSHAVDVWREGHIKLGLARPTLRP